MPPVLDVLPDLRVDRLDRCRRVDRPPDLFREVQEGHAPLPVSKSAGPKETDVAIPIHAPPGEAQVDFGYLGLFYDPATGKMRKTWVFVLVMAQRYERCGSFACP